MIRYGPEMIGDNDPHFGSFFFGLANTGGGLLILDNFVDPSGTAIAAHAIAPTNTPGTSWTSLAAGLVVQGNAITGDGTGNDIAVCDAGQLNVSVSVTLATDGVSHTGLVARAKDANNYVWFSRQGRLEVNVAGTFTQRGSAAVTNANGDVIKMSWSGNTVSCYQNGTSLYSYTLNAGEIAAFGTDTHVGLFANVDATVRFKPFQVSAP
jgi:hypothetical protein